MLSRQALFSSLLLKVLSLSVPVISARIQHCFKMVVRSNMFDNDHDTHIYIRTYYIYIYIYIYAHCNQNVSNRSGQLISLLFLMLSCLSCVLLAGAVSISDVASVSITSGSNFTGNSAVLDGGMYDCDEDW